MTKTRGALVIIALLFVLVVVLILGKQPEPLPRDSLSAKFLLPGAFEFTSLDVELVDRSRKTNANNDYAGSNKRSLSITIWHPRSLQQGPFPLIIYSHGFSSYRKEATYLGEHLASLGYIVAAADYPLTNISAAGGPQAQDVVNQPADISFIIDSMMAWNDDKNHLFAASINAKKIGVMGVSLGGLTTTMAAYDPHRRDPRISAAASIAGPSNLFAKQYFSHVNIPFMMLATDQDALIDYELNALPIIEKVPGALLVTIKGASHTGFGHGTDALRWMNNPDAIGCFVVTNNLSGDEENWMALFGSPEDGILYDAQTRLCETDPLPPAMNPMRQHMLTILAVSSFFQSYFGDHALVRKANYNYLTQQMAAELSDITVRRAAL